MLKDHLGASRNGNCISCDHLFCILCAKVTTKQYVMARIFTLEHNGSIVLFIFKISAWIVTEPPCLFKHFSKLSPGFVYIFSLLDQMRQMYEFLVNTVLF
uniref:Uncharacterized protein n=1 Tax=Pyxicephalus adspersus TaxID=30357 RepID=A0AAV2ZJL0_PYXAD|nr:TPA: hypothetical protein GDO54_005182 [Pyxicephalus adspersus]